MSTVGIGDLIRLKDDENMLVGIGIVLERREDTYELAREIIDGYNDLMASVDDDFQPEILTAAEAKLLKTPVYLVLWHSADDHTFSSKPIWMYDSEISIVNSAVRKKEE